MCGIDSVQRSSLVRVLSSDANTERHQHDYAGGRQHLARNRSDVRARLLLVAVPSRHVHRSTRCSLDYQRQPRSGRAQVTCRPETHERAAMSRKQRYVDACFRRRRLHRLSGTSVCPKVADTRSRNRL